MLVHSRVTLSIKFTEIHLKPGQREALWELRALPNIAYNFAYNFADELPMETESVARDNNTIFSPCLTNA